MWIFIIVAIIFIVLIFLVPKRKKSGENKKTNYTAKQYYAPTTKQRRIEDCISKEDFQYQTSYEVKRVISAVESRKTAIKNATIASNNNVSTAWLNSYEKVIKISGNLDENLKYHSNRALEQSKFHYYTNLHFRSMIAADITYKEYLKINDNFEAINNLIVDIAKTGRKTGMTKEQIYSAKDSLKELRRVFLNRVHQLNQQTATLRDKIGRECGTRGQQWRIERMRNHR